MSRLNAQRLRACQFAALAAAFALMLVPGALVHAQTIRNYNVQFAATPPTIDGTVGATEWNAAAAAAGTWGVLRETAADVDTENNRFRMMWDATNLYILYETDFNVYLDADKVGVPNPTISFGADNLNLYFDPNTDDEENLVPPVNETDGTSSMVDGYQLAFNQYHDPDNGALISTNANRQGVGIYTEAHADTPFGNQANWGGVGVDLATGPAMQDIVVAQRNGATGGLAEIAFPWANFNADDFVPGVTDASDFNSDGLVDGGDFLIWQNGFGPNPGTDKSTGDANLDFVVDAADLELWRTAYGIETRVLTGLEHLTAPVNGDEWFFNMSRINGEGGGDNFLPIWNWQGAQSFAFRAHGTLTFAGGPAASGVPEPGTAVLLALAALALGSARRRAA